ncbi:Rep [Bat associated circovirus 3]|uniref:Replication-associated protein n=1 Tax=Bat associated circovirus 3 TaxID=1868220 RepID=I3VR56_9CIRC|nr:Rep [Rhinolophus ferrumequinum circovirus 1]AFK85001.1 Rep [Rhinolophus ferrumequinum circovirus 1]
MKGDETPGRRWCFTINNYDTPDLTAVNEAFKEKDVVYAVCGKEVGKKGTKHLQGFIHFTGNWRFNRVKSLLGGRAHIEKARGNDEQNKVYCTKEETYLEVGSPQFQGKRNDLGRAVAALEGGSSLSEVAQANPEVFIRYGRGLRDYMNVRGLVKPRDFKTHVIVLVGEPGSGKSKYANEVEGTKYWKPRGQWWDGYNGEEVVVLDDFYGWVPYDELLRVGDRYPLKVQVKGAFVDFVSKTLVITSNKRPEEWYDKEKIPDQSAMWRRFNEMYYCERGEPIKPYPDEWKEFETNF